MTATRKQFIGQLEEPGERPRNIVLTGQFKEPTWFTKVKSLAETKQSDSTLANDSELVIPIDAEGVYVLQIELYFDTGATPDFKFAITGPTSPDEVVLRGHHVAVGDTNDTDFVDTSFGTTHAVTGTGGTTGGFAEISGLLNNGPNAGTVNVQWAQNTSDASDTTLLAGSHIRWLKVGAA